jgi:hypothetical protein
MRPFEGALVGAELLCFLVLLLPQLRATSWSRYLPFLVALLAIAQVVGEGWRWQFDTFAPKQLCKLADFRCRRRGMSGRTRAVPRGATTPSSVSASPRSSLPLVTREFTDAA